MAHREQIPSHKAQNTILAATAPGNAALMEFVYEIRIRDHLETYWHRWFDGWTLTNLEGGEVLLSRPNADQSALHGALNKIRDLNLTLLSLTRKSSGPD